MCVCVFVRVRARLTAHLDFTPAYIRPFCVGGVFFFLLFAVVLGGGLTNPSENLFCHELPQYESNDVSANTSEHLSNQLAENYPPNVL